MHNNYYLIRQIVPVLQNHLKGSELKDCFSQNKDELIFQFELPDKNVFNIIAHLDPQFTCLSFPVEYHKAKKNTVQIFKELLNKKVNNVVNFKNERAFAIHFDIGVSLLFKLYGHQSNIILYKENSVISIFRSSLKKDFNIGLIELNRQIDQSDTAIGNNLDNLRAVYPTLDKQMLNQLEEEIINLEPDMAVLKIKEYINQLEYPGLFYVIDDGNKLRLSLIPKTNIVFNSNSPIEALNYFFKQYIRKHKLQTGQQTVLKDLQRQLTKTKGYLTKTIKKKKNLAENSSYKEMADVLMANLHLIKPHTKSIELNNFYSNTPITIKLNPKLSAQKNAEKYYTKGKNLGIEIDKLADIITSKEHLVINLQKEIENVKDSSSTHELQKITKSKGSKKNVEILPFKQFEIDGFTILVGKNAKNNDLLTLKYARKNDLFFHAKDVSGSHVILKEKSGIIAPAYIIEKTAAIAAYYSKRKTDSLCPVGYTPKKYIRKPKGSPPGMVMVEREKVLLVKPELPQ